jgi:hypothetical protein
LGGAIFLRIRPGLMNTHSAMKETKPMHDMHEMHNMGRTAGIRAVGAVKSGAR